MKDIRHQHLIFDMDDTLIYCNKYFNSILDEFISLVSGWFKEYGIEMDTIRQKQIEIDVAGVHQVGFASEHFPASLVETYRHFARLYGRPLAEREERQLRLLGSSVYEQEVEPYPGMVDTLEHLQQEGHTLYLYTGGETAIQQRKIDQMKLSTFFDDRIFIRQHKNIRALEEIITTQLLPRMDTWMIGNSLRSDVQPALQAALNTIYIKQEHEWAYDIVQLQTGTEQSFHTVAKLTEVPHTIQQHLHIYDNKRTWG
ncbi:HAD family hydrolase [Paenibacillus hunanensis]|uniref:Hydrolase of the HAD superfamily n=1 Tax=Paenibacillus hunanensis TaxID=539262 RepID=A0ABU1J501_9BACL|nr:HAD family hydrolase [Paenibacillus hunanensis]MCL9662300.1 HAD family hydrolase [Paenibacillus hunanensis]MDR6245652.1 putative hydrolase of the HAD superfamily [Paenibacillus hunanensis]GGJ28329.1 haloacid dehalogenase [Paenibacillus hunanensis]